MRLVLLVLAALAAPVLAQAPDLPPAPFRVAPAPEATLVTDPAPEVDAVRAGSAPTPASFAFQGVLEDGGQPVADGTYGVTVRLFDVATGGTALYAETHSVTTAGGVFALSVGGGTPASGSFASVNFSEAVWVEVAVGGTTLSPRTATEPAPTARTLAAGATILGAVSFEDDLGPTGFPAALAVENTAPALGGATFGIYAKSGSTLGYGVLGDGTRYGVYGQATSELGQGVSGRALASTGITYGVFGMSQSGSGIGVGGYVDDFDGVTYGVYGRSRSTSGHGVYGLADAGTGTTYGVYGSSRSTSGRGVSGLANAGTGTTYGVYGSSRSTSGRGVYGEASAATGATVGGFFENASTSGRAVYGSATATSGLTRGVDGRSASTGGRGVYGEASASTGATVGVAGASVSTSGYGVQGVATATSGTTYGVYGRVNSSTGWAGFFEGGQGVYTDESYVSGGADLAEFFPLAPAASVAPGDLVGLRGGHVSLDTEGAEQVMVASSDPAFVGNPDAEAGGALVALVGQVEVRLAGPASVGDLLVASGRDDGTARAVAPERYAPEADGPVAGRVLSLSEAGRAVALVGVDEAAALRAVVAAQADEIAALRADRDRQQAQLDALARRLDTLSSPARPAAVAER